MTMTTYSTAAMVDFTQLPSVSPNKNPTPNQYALRYVLVKAMKNLIKLSIFLVFSILGLNYLRGTVLQHIRIFCSCNGLFSHSGQFIHGYIMPI